MRNKEKILDDWKQLQDMQCHSDTCDLCYHIQLELAKELKEIDLDSEPLRPCGRLNKVD